MIAGSDRVSCSFVPRFDGPNDVCPAEKHRLGRLRQSRRFCSIFPAALLCNARVARKCVMSGRTNWSRIKQRSLMRRRGVEDIKGATSVAIPPPKQPRRKLSKAELREQAAAAFLAWRAGHTSKNK